MTKEISREEALLKFLREEVDSKYELEDIEESKYDSECFLVNRRKVKRGTSPAEAKRLADLARAAIFTAFSGEDDLFRVVRQKATDGEFLNSLEELKSKNFNPILYDFLRHVLGKKVPDLLKVGTHDVLNTLYFLYNPDDYKEVGKEYSHSEAIRKAFDGEKVADTRELEETEDGEYLVLTDEEADERARESLDNYIEECVLSQIPDNLVEYFDTDQFAEDALRNDGRGVSLASYDSEEFEVEGFYIYRIN